MCPLVHCGGSRVVFPVLVMVNFLPVLWKHGTMVDRTISRIDVVVSPLEPDQGDSILHRVSKFPKRCHIPHPLALILDDVAPSQGSSHIVSMVGRRNSVQCLSVVES